MMNDFLQQGAQIPQAPSEGFMMEPMRNGQQFGIPQTGISDASQFSAWAKEYNPIRADEQARMEAAFHISRGSLSPAEFQRMNLTNPGQPVGATAMPAAMNGYQSYQRPLGMGIGMNNIGMVGLGGLGVNMGMIPQTQFTNFETTDKGKGKMIELDDAHWEEQFKQIDMQGQEEDESLAMEKELNEMDRSVLESETNEFGDFESIWRGIQAETAAAREMIAEENLFSEGIHSGDFDKWDGFDGLGTHTTFRDPMLGVYMFEEDNIFRNLPNPFEDGQRIMQEGGNLSLAALAFESAVQKDPQHVEAWVALGSTQAQNEKETPAIRALEQALKLEPTNLDALAGLAVSYTNEGYESTAYRTLERWLSIKYPSIAPPGSHSTAADVGFTDQQLLHQKVTDLFISAAQLSPDAETMDPDVQVGLGVLFYGIEEYDKAVDCFSAALASTESGISNDKSTVHLLWNRLGATLANSGRSEEAIAAYERALSLRPNFVRARYNLGVSCINIGCYEEAATHLLGALAMHKITEQEGREKAKDILGGDGPGRPTEAELEKMINQNHSTNLYDTLRRVFSQMGRRDLVERVVSGMDVDSFRGEFEF
jgi:peroxin-5